MKPTWTTCWTIALAMTAVLPVAAWPDETGGQDNAKPTDAARNDLDYRPPSWPEPPDAGAMLRRLGIGTMTVLGLCAGTLWLGKAWLRGTPAKGGEGGQLRLLESVTLGNRCVVHLVRAGDQQVLVGVDSAGIKSLVPLLASFENTLAHVGPTAPKDEAIADRELPIEQ